MSSGTPIPQLYLVPCTCGKRVQVRARQAGDQVTCACGAVVNVPTIRGLKQLETVVDEEERPDAPRSSWQGPIFSLGLVALFIGAMIFFVTWLTPPDNLHTDWQNIAASAADAERAKKPVSELGVSDLYDEFTMLRDRTRSTPWDEARRAAESAQAYQRNRHLAGGIVLGVGALFTILGLMLPAFSSRQ